MSRSRNIKPGFFKNEVLVTLPFEQRLLFIGLWTIADRAGRFEDRPTKIKMEVFPADDVDVDAGLQALHDRGFILRYSSNETRYCQVLAWAKHQNPHCKEVPSTIPAPCLHGASTVQAPEFPERARLIPDSLNLIPDSGGGGESPPAHPRAANEVPKKTYDPDVGDAIDRRKLAKAFERISSRDEANIGSHGSMTREQRFEWACELAGLSVKRGLEVSERGRQWPQEASA